MIRSSLVLASVMTLALGLGGCAADGAPGPAGPAGEKGADGTPGADGEDGNDGQNGLDGKDGIDGIDGANMPGAKTVSVFADQTMPVPDTAAEALLGTISAPGKGKIIAIANMDAYCGSGECATSGVTDGTYWLSDQDDGRLPSGQPYEYFHLTPQATENTSRTVVFGVAAAGDVKIKLMVKSGNGAFSLYRRSLTLLFVPEA